jgi:RES domain
MKQRIFRMAKAGSKYALPAGPLKATRITWKKGKPIHRIHSSLYTEMQYNPSAKGNARFSPIRDAVGEIIPVLYGGSTMDCALMETVFRDVPYSPGLKSVDKARLDGQVYSVVLAKADLRLIDLGNVALRKLGIDRAHLIDTTKAHYPDTRKWAEAIYRQFPKCQGLRWISRQDDSSEAILLFGDRIPAATLTVVQAAAPLVVRGLAALPVLYLARKIGVKLTGRI